MLHWTRVLCSAAVPELYGPPAYCCCLLSTAVAARRYSSLAKSKAIIYPVSGRHGHSSVSFGKRRITAKVDTGDNDDCVERDSHPPSRDRLIKGEPKDRSQQNSESHDSLETSTAPEAFDPFTVDPFHGGPTGQELKRRHARLGREQHERRQWTWSYQRKLINKNPSQSERERLRPPFGGPQNSNLARGVPSREELKSRFEKILEEELDLHHKRKINPPREDDPFDRNPFYNGGQGDASARACARLAVEAENEADRLGNTKAGIFEMERHALREAERLNPLHLSETERQRRYFAGIADMSDTEDEWCECKDEEMKYLAEFYGIRATLLDGETLVGEE